MWYCPKKIRIILLLRSLNRNFKKIDIAKLTVFQNRKCMNLEKSEYQNLLEELVSLIEDTKHNVVTYANSSLTILFWHIGERILNHTLQNQRAEYGKQIVVTVSRQLVERFGTNYEEKNLRRMIQLIFISTCFFIIINLKDLLPLN